MSDPHTITDATILAAWNADVAEHGDSVPMHGETGLEFWMAAASTTTEEERRVLGFWQPGDERRIEIVRGLLGGWDAVWHAVLKDEGFEASKQYADEWDLDINGVMVAVHHWAGRVGWELTLRRGGESVPLRSPADLRVRVGHAKGLFGEGTR